MTVYDIKNQPVSKFFNRPGVCSWVGFFTKGLIYLLLVRNSTYL